MTDAAATTGATPTLSPDEVQGFADVAARLSKNVSSVVLGKPELVRLALTGLFAEGHLLLEDVPGVGKTTLARAIAASVRGSGGASSSPRTCCRRTFPV